MRRYSFILFLLCFGATSYLTAQLSYEDSLIYLMDEIADEESRGRILNEIIWYNRRNYDRAIELLEEADKLAEKYNRLDYKAMYAYDRGCVNRFAGNFRNGIKSLIKAEAFFIELQDTLNVANSNYQLGACYSNLGYYDQAQENYYNALENYELIRDSMSMALVMNGIAVDLRKVNRPVDALKYYHQALDIYRNQNSLVGQADVLHNLGNLYSETGEYEKALKYYKEQEIYDRKTNYKAGIAYLYQAMGYVYQLKGEPSVAITEYNKAISLWDSLQNQKFIAASRIKKSKALTDIARYNDAQYELKQGMEWAQSQQDKQEILEAYEAHAYLYEQMNIPYESIKYLKKYEALKDSLRGDDVRTQINELNAKYDLNQKNAEIKELELQNELNTVKLSKRKLTTGLWAGLALILLMITGGTIHRTKQLKKIQQLQHQHELNEKLSKIDQLSERIGELINKKNIIELKSRTELNDLLDNTISAREYEILTSIAQGQTNKEISQSQFISENTVKFHLKNIYSKLEVHNRKEAVNKVATLT